ncbi:MAG: 5'-deoxyadenosine deaminase [Pyrinomonadaceae bacterium]
MHFNRPLVVTLPGNGCDKRAIVCEAIEPKEHEKLFVSETIRIKNGTLVTMDANDSIVTGDLLIKNQRIVRVGENETTKADVVIDAHNCVVLPGFVQTHIHLCQTLFRGAADDLALIDWLKQRIWKMEAAHDASSIRASAQLGVAELIKGGTTCALTMETVKHTSEVFKVVEGVNFRATVGKCMMDAGGEDVPQALREKTIDSINESLELLARWHGAANGRIRYCFAPRFAVSCTRELLAHVAELSRTHSVVVHTHASENRAEIEIVEQATGQRNINYLNSLGLAAPHVALAHCVHVDEGEMRVLAETGTQVLHCPSSNMKLGSGIAPVVEMLAHGINVSLGADGAACNNRLDMFTEMRGAALLQKALHGAEALPAKRVLRMATIDGARALGLQDEIGSLEAGKRADVIIADLESLSLAPRTDIISTLVYAAQTSNVRDCIIDGRIVMRDGELQTLNEREVIRNANRESEKLRARIET